MSIASVRRAGAFVIAALILTVAFGALYVWRDARHGGAEHQALPPPSVSTVNAQPQSVAEELQAVGSLQAVNEVMLKPDVSGRVTAINFESGQMVKKGDVLVNLYDAPEQADRAAAVAHADFAQLQLRRSQGLAGTGAEPHAMLDQRESESDQARAAVRQLDARIQQKVIHAPFSGQIGIRRINLGQYLDTGDAVATLTQLDPLYVNFTLPQQNLPLLTIGAPVQVTVDAVPNQVFSGSISTIEPRVDNDTRNVAVQALLHNVDQTLKSGMYATTRLILPSTIAIVLPLTAIQPSVFGDHVMLVQDINAKGIGKVVSRPVTTGRRLGDDIVVLEGVEAGDTVVIAGQNRLSPGGEVKINNVEPTASAANAVVSVVKPSATSLR